MQRKEDEERARERQQQNANHSAPAMDEPEYVELPRIPELSPEEQAALDKSTEKSARKWRKFWDQSLRHSIKTLHLPFFSGHRMVPSAY